MTPSYAREVVVVLTHLALWSQLGVLTRIYLDALFIGGCNGSWGLCLTSEGVDCLHVVALGLLWRPMALMCTFAIANALSWC